MNPGRYADGKTLSELAWYSYPMLTTGQVIKYTFDEVIEQYAQNDRTIMVPDYLLDELLGLELVLGVKIRYQVWDTNESPQKIDFINGARVFPYNPKYLTTKASEKNLGWWGEWDSKKKSGGRPGWSVSGVVAMNDSIGMDPFDGLHPSDHSAIAGLFRSSIKAVRGKP
jgi:hypothetical protein